MTVVVVALIAYLFGSVPVGVLVARTYGIDIQRVGSGNVGATNVLRAAGWGPALVVAVADMFKGGLAVLLAQAFRLPGWEVAVVAIAAVLGHNYSMFLGFRGGKGVATSLGTIALTDPGLGAAVAVLAVGTILTTRFVSAGSIVGALASVVFAIAMNREGWVVAICLGLSGMILFKHRENLARMYEGVERRIDQRGIRSAAARPYEPPARRQAPDQRPESGADADVTAAPAPARPE